MASPPARASVRILRALAGPVILIALAVWVLHGALFSGGRLVPAWPYTDLFSAYMPWRYFAFQQWGHGQFPWWDPHVFCGLPFFAQVQSCLFYPVAWVNFLFNPATGITLEMVLDTIIGALAMYTWARARGISRGGATLAGAVFSLSGAVYLHVLDGYVTVLASAAWMPLIFLALDRLLAERFLSGILTGAIAVCLENLAGHTQLVYYTFLIGGLYVLLESIGRPRLVRLYGAFAALWLLGGMLAAVQLLPTYLATQLSIRASGVSYGYASMLSFPPENLLTLFIPYPLGGIAGGPYMGRWLLWESSWYVGLVALVLACIGFAELKFSSRWRMLLLLVITMVLTLGAYTPVHWLLYEFLPGFGLFRGPSKFSILGALLLAVLAGHGWDRVRRGEIGSRAISLSAIGAGVCVLLAIAFSHFDSTHGPIGWLLRFVHQSPEYMGPARYFHEPFVTEYVARRMALQWNVAAALLGVSSLLFYFRRFSIRPAYLLLVIAIAEVYFAAAASNTLSSSRQPFLQQWTPKIIDSMEHDQRLLFTNDVTDANVGEMLGYDSIWGYSNGQPRQFTKLFAASQGAHPQWADEYEFAFHRPSRLFQLLRCRYILQWSDKYPVLTVRDPMPHLQLLGNYVRMNNPDAINASLVGNFDFRHSAILQADPAPLPTAAGAAGRAVLLKQSINDLEIQADLPAPALLLITDAYAPGWHVRPIEANANQSSYEVIQADNILRAIPLSRGHHHFDLYYAAPGFCPGIAISMLGALLCAATAIRLQCHHSQPTH